MLAAKEKLDSVDDKMNPASGCGVEHRVEINAI